MRTLVSAMNAHQATALNSDSPAHEYSLNQVLVLNRSTSAKLIEFFKLCVDYKGQVANHIEDPLFPIAAKLSKDAENWRTTQGYDLALWFRNKATNHYILQEFRELFSNTRDQGDFHIYFHEKGSNCGHFVGEQLLYRKFGTLSPDEYGDESEIAYAKEVEIYFDWVLSATKAVIENHNDFVIDFLKFHFPDKRLQTLSVEFPDQLIAKPAEIVLPTFWDFRS